MIKKIELRYFLLFLPLLLLIFIYFLPRTNLYDTASSQISTGLLLDLLITTPLIYLAVIWKLKIPKISVLYVFIACLILGTWLLPQDQKLLLEQIKKISIPLIEIGLVSIVGYKLVSIKKRFKSNKINTNDFYVNLSIAYTDILGDRIGSLLANEIAVFYYLFAKTENHSQINQYSNHKKTNIYSSVGVFIFLIIIELFVAHFLINKFNTTLAWILSILTAYSLLQIIAVLRSLKFRKSYLDSSTKHLILNYGFACHTQIPLGDIEKIELSKRSLKEKKGNLKLSLFDIFDSHNIIIYLNKENILHKLYGIKKKYKNIAVFLDEPDKFKLEIDKYIMDKQEV